MFISHIRKTVGFWDIGEMGFSRDKKIIMKNYKGVIIEESLENTDVLSKVRIVRTKVEKVTKKHKTPWIKEWTLHTVHIPEKKAASIAKKLSKSLDSKHSWYADFKNKKTHFIIFRNKIFKIDRSSREEYEKATKYGVSLGIPSYQVNFAPNVIKWER